MNTYEELVTSANGLGVSVTEYPFSDRIKGLYCDSAIGIKKDIETTTEKACTLAEELGHFYTTTGDILDQSSPANRKQELRARAWAYNKLIGLRGIIKIHDIGCNNFHEAADCLNVTEGFLLEALQYYKAKFGTFTKLDNYVIYFEPSLGVFELR